MKNWTSTARPPLSPTSAPGVPPTIFIEGERDTLKIGRAEMMDRLKALNIETAVHTLKDAPPFWMSDSWCAETVDVADKFLQEAPGVGGKIRWMGPFKFAPRRKIVSATAV